MAITSSNVIPYITEWVFQHQNSKNIGQGFDVLWDLVAGRQSWEQKSIS
ncbi:hypothetical protein BJP36_35960 [Moorena producens JHB]|uniref:Uncharacterized protein n=1 Tax=Moorena producens (strain JHB) TaxID=1454205 RepID=A0A9Q9STS4_MOOP1|nr:hypothetical protein [Moorena producens]WAN69490.1 hypothetical protein BJP36_35960 [Moorena producens JHB]